VSATDTASAYETLQGLVGPTITSRPGGRRWRVLVAVVLVVLLGAGGTTGWRWWQLRDARTGYLLAVEELSAALSGLHLDSERGREVLDAVGDQVLDAQLVVDLGHLVDQAAASRREVRASERLPNWSRGRVTAIAGSLRVEAEQARELREALETTRGQVQGTHEDWRYASARTEVDEATAALAATAEQGASVLAETEGQVADPGVREPLAAELDAAMHALATELNAEASIEDLQAAASAHRAGRERLEAAIAAVRESQQALANQRALERAAAAGTSGASSSGAQGGGGGKSSAAASGGGGSASTPPATGGTGGAASSGTGGTTQRKELNPGRAATDGTPGKVTVSATTSWEASAVTATVAGVTLPMSRTGPGTYAATFENLPAGRHAWSVTADGVTAHGAAATVF
jgi:hypothetical protein